MLALYVLAAIQDVKGSQTPLVCPEWINRQILDDVPHDILLFVFTRDVKQAVAIGVIVVLAQTSLDQHIKRDQSLSVTHIYRATILGYLIQVTFIGIVERKLQTDKTLCHHSNSYTVYFTAFFRRFSHIRSFFFD
jgi:hypothetical protein